MRLYCPNCNAEREVSYVAKQETLVVRGEPVQVRSRVAQCTKCGQEIVDMLAEDENLKAAYDVYRSRHGLLGSDDIRLIREKYDLSQRALSRVLGWGIITIQRYERGALQDRIHDTVLKKVRDDPAFLRGLLEENRSRLSAKEFDRIDRMLLEMLAERPDAQICEAYAEGMDSSDRADAERGHQSYDQRLLKQVMGRIISSISRPFKTKVAKTLWLTDFSAFARLGKSITGLSYCRMPYGPAPDRYQLILGELECEGAIYLNPCQVEPTGGELVEMRQDAGTDLLSDDELAVIDKVVARYGHLSSGQLSRRSHKEAIWAARSDGEHLPYCEAASVIMVKALL